MGTASTHMEIGSVESVATAEKRKHRKMAMDRNLPSPAPEMMPNRLRVTGDGQQEAHPKTSSRVSSKVRNSLASLRFSTPGGVELQEHGKALGNQ